MADTTLTLTERQAALDRRILRELLAGAPASWTQVELVVGLVWSGGILELAIEVRSPEGHASAPAEITVGLTTALSELAHLFQDHGITTRRLRGLARLVDGDWRYAYTLA